MTGISDEDRAMYAKLYRKRGNPSWRERKLLDDLAAYFKKLIFVAPNCMSNIVVATSMEELQAMHKKYIGIIAKSSEKRTGGRKKGRNIGSKIRVKPYGNATIMAIHCAGDGLVTGYTVKTNKGPTLEVTVDGIIQDIKKSHPMKQIPTPQERDTLDLLTLVCELHARCTKPTSSKEQGLAYIAAREELERRIKHLPASTPPRKERNGRWYPIDVCVTCERELSTEDSAHTNICRHCGRTSPGTMCDTKAIVVRRITIQPHPYWHVWKRFHLWEGKSSVDAQWLMRHYPRVTICRPKK